jgi:hypothetical protein
MFRFPRRILKLRSIFLGVVAGPVLSFAIYYYPTLNASAEHGQLHMQVFDDCTLAIVVGVGALFGVLLGLTIGDYSLPSLVKYTSIGALLAVSIIVFMARSYPGVLCPSAPKGETRACGVYYAQLFVSWTLWGIVISVIIGLITKYLRW